MGREPIFSWFFIFISFFAGGAGGKGTWGALGCEFAEEDGSVFDCKDPNYDDENLDNKDVKLKVLDLEKVAEEVGVSPYIIWINT